MCSNADLLQGTIIEKNYEELKAKTVEPRRPEQSLRVDFSSAN